MATFKIFSPQILEVYRILLVETTLEPYYVRSMHRAAVWQHSSNLNIKIVYNLFLVEFVWFLFRWCPPLSVDCCRKLFPSVTPSENSQVGWDNRNRIAKVCRFDAKWVCPWKVMPEVFKCSAWESVPVAPHFLNRTLEYLRYNFPWGRLISCQTDNPWPSYSQDLNPPYYSLRGYLKDRVCENNPQTKEDSIRREIRRILQEMLNRVVDNFNVRVAAVLP